MLGTGRLPDELVGNLSDWFRVTQEDGGEPSSELRAERILHVFLTHLAYGVAPVPGL